jgi:serine/threonine protein kinase
MTNIANGIQYLHSQGVVHCDIKPVCGLVQPWLRRPMCLQQNILLREEVGGPIPVIIDFGLVIVGNDYGVDCVPGSTRARIDQFTDTGDEQPTSARDMWSYGCLYFWVRVTFEKYLLL